MPRLSFSLDDKWEKKKQPNQSFKNEVKAQETYTHIKTNSIKPQKIENHYI